MDKINFVSAADAAAIAAGMDITPVDLTAEEKAEISEKLEPVLLAYPSLDLLGVLVYEATDTYDYDAQVIRDSDNGAYLLISSLAAAVEPVAFAIIATDALARDDDRMRGPALGNIPDNPIDAAIEAAQAAQAAAEAAHQAMLAAARVLVSFDQLSTDEEEGPADED